MLAKASGKMDLSSISATLQFSPEPSRHSTTQLIRSTATTFLSSRTGGSTKDTMEHFRGWTNLKPFRSMARSRSRSGEEVMIFLHQKFLKAMRGILPKMLAIAISTPKICQRLKYFKIHVESQANSWQSASILERHHRPDHQIRQASDRGRTRQQSAGDRQDAEQRVGQRHHLVKHPHLHPSDLRIRRGLQSAQPQVPGRPRRARADDQQSQEADRGQWQKLIHRLLMNKYQQQAVSLFNITLAGPPPPRSPSKSDRWNRWTSRWFFCTFHEGTPAHGLVLIFR